MIIYKEESIMWDRKKLKEIAKEKFQANYWKCVLVALLFSFIMGGASGGFSGGGNQSAGHLADSKRNVPLGPPALYAHQY